MQPAMLPSAAADPAPPVRGLRVWLSALWRRWGFTGPSPIDLQQAVPRWGAMRAFHEIGSDYLPSSGTWPLRTPRD
jgi:hypothetical protein